MSADDRIDGPEHDLYDETPPRSIFATMWFRALLVLIVLAVVVAVAAPYILDATNPPTKPTIASRPQSAPSPPALTPSPAPSTPMSSALTDADKAPTTPVPPDRVPADKPATALPAPGKPLAGATTAPADKSAPTGRVATSDKPAASDRSTVTEKVAAVPKPAAAETSTVTEKAEKSTPTDKKDARMVAAAPEVQSEAKSSATTTKRVAARNATTASAATNDEWWVQVGAYRDESTARKLAERLRGQSYSVQESVKAPSANRSAPLAPSAASPTGADQYDVFVSGVSTTELSPRLGAKGLTAEASGSGVVIKPSLPLRDAVALSKDLATDGLKVQVRRAGSPTGETTVPAGSKRLAPAASSGDPLYRVRVGGFPDHATAVTTLRELEAKGYKPFIARGGS